MGQKPPYLMSNRELWRKLRNVEKGNYDWSPQKLLDEWNRRRGAWRDWMLIFAAFLAAIAALVTACNSITQTQRLRSLDPSLSQPLHDSEHPPPQGEVPSRSTGSVSGRTAPHPGPVLLPFPPRRAMGAHVATSADSDGVARTFSGGRDSLRIRGRERKNPSVRKAVSRLRVGPGTVSQWPLSAGLADNEIGLAGQ